MSMGSIGKFTLKFHNKIGFRFKLWAELHYLLNHYTTNFPYCPMVDRIVVPPRKFD